MSELPVVMVVEDEYDLQGIMEEALAESGFATDILSSGEEALTLFRGGLKNYRALVADVGLMAGPALAKGTMTTAAKDKQATVAKSHHMQRHAAYRGERYRNASATLTSDQYRRPVGPIGAAGAVVGGAVATAGAIATAPFRAFDNSYIATMTIMAMAMAVATGRPMRLATALPVRLAPWFAAEMAYYTPASNLVDTEQKKRRLYEPPFPSAESLRRLINGQRSVGGDNLELAGLTAVAVDHLNKSTPASPAAPPDPALPPAPAVPTG